MSEAEHDETIRIDSLPVHDDGRITIPKPIWSSIGLVAGQLVTMRVIGDESSDQFNPVLSSGRRVTIPRRIRDSQGIDGTDSIDIELVAL